MKFRGLIIRLLVIAAGALIQGCVRYWRGVMRSIAIFLVGIAAVGCSKSDSYRARDCAEAKAAVANSVKEVVNSQNQGLRQSWVDANVAAKNWEAKACN